MLKSMNFLREKSRGRVGGLLRCARNDCASNGEGWHRPWCHKILGTRPRMTGGRGANSFGRSMIEMLGVLAIIGVLSVGGIAGYSKAMEKYKMNKVIGEYSYLIQGLLQHADDLKKLPNNYSLNNLIQALNIVPETWKVAGLYTDSYGNQVSIFSRSGYIVFDIFFGKTGSKDNQSFMHSFSSNACFEFFQNISQPLHEMLYRSWAFHSRGSSTLYYGDKYCGGDKLCLKDITLQQMKDACSACSAGNELCTLTLEF